MDKELLKKVKTVRDITKIGYVYCIEALKNSDNNIEKAIDWLKKQGMVNSAIDVSSKETKEGIVKCICNEKSGVIFEVNCQTDFVAKNSSFCKLVDDFAKKCLDTEEINTFEQAKELFFSMASLIIMAIKEKFVFSRFERIYKKEHECFGFYNHIGKVSTIVILKKKDDDLAKKIAVHIASNDVRYINFRDIDEKIINKEKEIVSESVKNDKKMNGKPKEIIDKIIMAKIHKNMDQFVLNEQNFLYDDSKKVSYFLGDNEVVNFFKYIIDG